jgi:hypothetical protein
MLLDRADRETGSGYMLGVQVFSLIIHGGIELPSLPNHVGHYMVVASNFCYTLT